ncbi:MAG TPA: DUF6443 domain-containing protein, partial [Flavobacterium sp.]|nr:DUF6443 domain-containing protein [Flavobacterium sp.]
MMKTILTTFCILFSIIVLGQATEYPSLKADMPEVIPPSPTVASLMKFEQTPVSNYTGVPEVSIPLFSLGTHSKNINLSAALAYHPASVAADEIASYTGLGWNLIAGGTISRTVRGYADESISAGPKIGIYYENMVNNSNRYHEIVSYSPPANMQEAQIKSEYLWDAFEKGKYDTEHDLYQYNFMGKAGRFYVERDSSGTLVPIKLDDDDVIRIEVDFTFTPGTPYVSYDTYTVNKFVLFDEYGYRYVFDKKEVTTETTNTQFESHNPFASPTSTLSPSGSYTSAYQLGAVYDNNSNLLAEFDYYVEQEQIIDVSWLRNIINGNSSFITDHYSSDQAGFEIVGLLPKTVTTSRARNINTQKLKTIRSIGFGSMEFELENGRLDYNIFGAKRLKRVVRKDYYGTPLDSFDFSYTHSAVSERFGSRLILSGLTQRNFSDPQELHHDFSYIPAPEMSDDIIKDSWGYFTSKPSFETGDYREPNPQIGKIDLLAKITYPTGGCAVFDYEANTYAAIGNETLMNFDANPENWTTASIDFELTASAGEGTRETLLFLNAQNEEKLVSITYDVLGEGNGQVKLYKVVNGVDTLVSGWTSLNFVLSANTTYKMSLTWFDINTTGSCNVHIHYKTRKSLQYQFLYGGGNRIKTIGYFTENVASDYYSIPPEYVPAKELHYSYNYFDNPSKTSGVLAFARPIFSYYVTKACNATDFGPTSITYKTETDTNALVPTKTKGSDVGYRFVTVSEVGKGRTEFTYTSAWEYPETDYMSASPPFVPSKNFDYKRGLLLKESTYDQNSNKIQEVQMDYEITDRMAMTGFRARHAGVGCPAPHSFATYQAFVSCLGDPDCPRYWRFGANCEPGEYLNYVEIKEAFGWVRLKNKVTRQFFYSNSSSSFVENEQSYSYNVNNKKIAYVLSSSGVPGKSAKTSYQYHSGNSSYSKNRIAEIERIDVERVNTNITQGGNDTEMIYTIRATYSNNWGANNSFLPASLWTAKGESANQEERIQFNRYDSWGNVIEVQQKENIKITYLYGYNKAYPVAKIDNMAYQDIPSNLITAIENATPVTIGSALDALRADASVANAMVTTLTYKPGVGVSTVTDPRGYTTRYIYDSFGRLSQVQDHDGNILSENEYHYGFPNWVKTKTYKVATTTAIANPAAEEAQINVTYLDGLGRPIEQIAGRMSGDGYDLITPISYDAYGRQDKEWLPFPSDRTDQPFIDPEIVKADAITFYGMNYSEERPFSEIQFEASRLNRVLKQAAPGTAWAMGGGHEIKFDYQTNANSEVKRLSANSVWSGAKEFYEPTLTDDGFYAEGQLYKTITYDENSGLNPTEQNGSTVEFKDKEGRVVLKR